MKQKAWRFVHLPDQVKLLFNCRSRKHWSPTRHLKEDASYTPEFRQKEGRKKVNITCCRIVVNGTNTNTN